MTENPVNLYDNFYANYANDAEAAVRRETYGEDLGQSSWLTAPEWLGFADKLGIDANTDVLEVGSGSGGPAVYLAAKRGCRITGVDINEHGVRNATSLASSNGLADRARFETVDANKSLPFADASFDVIVSNDAMCHIADRASALRDWHRILRPGGRACFTDAMIITGPVSHHELATRSSIGFYIFVPPGANEAMFRDAGFTVTAVEDVTDNAEAVSARWRDARARRRDALVKLEGAATFDGLQRFLDCVHELSAERRLSRFESPRDCRRLLLLREWSHDEENATVPVFSGGTRAGRAAGTGPRPGVRVAVGSDPLDRRKDRLLPSNAAELGTAGRA